MTSTEPLLSVRNLRKVFSLRHGPFRRAGRLIAVDGVSFDVGERETFALVGESGSGKSTIGRTILRLEEPTGGDILFRGRNLASMSPGELRNLRRDMQIVFQDPFGSLNPRLTVGRAIREALGAHGLASGAAARERVEKLLEMVGLSRPDEGRYPHEFSGGQRQRICIARALAVSPSFIIADEPVSALDVSIQAQIVNLLLSLQEKLGLSYLLITHNLAVVRHIANRVAVLYLGRIVEEGPTEEVFRDPFHPYTRGLLSAVPRANPRERGRDLLYSGEIPSPLRPPSGCPFHPRCPSADKRCRSATPDRFEPTPGHTVVCHLHEGGVSRG